MQSKRVSSAFAPGSRSYVTAPPGAASAHGAVPIAPILLFLGVSETDEADTAARDAAMELARAIDQPVLLLDLSVHGAQHAHFAACGALLPGLPQRLAAHGGVALFFHAVCGSHLWVSTLAPAGAAEDEGLWQRQVAVWPSVRRRLLDLFAAVVIAAPSTMRSPRGIALAGVADATILTLRDGEGIGRRAERLSHQVMQAGGRPAGVVITGASVLARG